MKKEIKEKRYTIDDIEKIDKFPNPDDSKELKDFESRGDEFWKDIKGIVRMLNKVNPKNPVYEYSSPIITNYLIWRMLFELKQLNLKTKIN